VLGTPTSSRPSPGRTRRRHFTTDRGRGIAGVIDGSPLVGVETDADVVSRHRLLREIGYKL